MEPCPLDSWRRFDKVIKLAARRFREGGRIKCIVGAGVQPELYKFVQQPDRIIKRRKQHLVTHYGELLKRSRVELSGVTRRSHRRQLRAAARKMAEAYVAQLRTGDYDRQFLLWDHYEYARFISANYPPGPALYTLFLMGEYSLTDCIVTTNYDMYFETIYQRVPTSKRLVVNPSVVHDRLDKSSERGDLRLWKIHGSFGALAFSKCDCVIDHPPCIIGAISPYMASIIAKHRPATSHDHPRRRASPGIEGGRYFCRGSDAASPVQHFTDQVFDRKAKGNKFGPFIRGAIQDLLSNPAVLLVVGFRCGVEEELRKVILQTLKKRSDIGVIMLLESNQKPLDDDLRNELVKHSSVYVQRGELDRLLWKVLARFINRTEAVDAARFEMDMKRQEGLGDWYMQGTR